MSRRTWIAIPFLMAGVLLVLSAGAQENQGVQASLADLLAADSMTREEMAGQYGALAGGGFEPPDCVPGDEMFDDVPASNIFCPWIEELARRGITGGCDADNYCPGDPVSRAQMAIFIVKTLEAARPMWAAVHADGTIVSQSGGISVQFVGDGGFRRLKFPSSAQGRAVVATVTTCENLGTPCGEPGIKAVACGGEQDDNCGDLDDTHVAVAPYIDGVQVDAGFYIAVLP